MMRRCWARPRHGASACSWIRRFRTSTCIAGVTVVTPNQVEAETATHARIRTDAEARDAARRLRERLPAATSVVITRGEQGMWVLDGASSPPSRPTSPPTGARGRRRHGRRRHGDRHHRARPGRGRVAGRGRAARDHAAGVAVGQFGAVAVTPPNCSTRSDEAAQHDASAERGLVVTSLAQVFAALNAMRAQGVIGQYTSSTPPSMRNRRAPTTWTSSSSPAPVKPGWSRSSAMRDQGPIGHARFGVGADRRADSTACTVTAPRIRPRQQRRHAVQRRRLQLLVRTGRARRRPRADVRVARATARW